MELQQLRYVIAIAELGNFTKAAARCNVTQPSLSQQIINLEKEVGHKLFHRLGHRAVATEAGSIFLERARRIISEVDDAAKELSDSPSLERRITVGAIVTLAPYLLPTLIKRSRERFPNIQISVWEDFRSNLVNAIHDGDLDLAILALPVDSPRVHVETLVREPLLLAVGAGHPLAERPKVTVEELTHESFVMLGTSSSLSEQVKNFCGDHNFEPKIGYRCAQLSTVKAFVAIGAGVAILPRIAKAPEDKGSIVYKALANADPYREIAVIRHLQRYQSRGAEQFLGLLRENVVELMKA
jgi:LysR family hydrogen peroxide-inducible transcriptional activator